MRGVGPRELTLLIAVPHKKQGKKEKHVGEIIRQGDLDYSELFGGGGRPPNKKRDIFPLSSLWGVNRVGKDAPRGGGGKAENGNTGRATN